MNFICFSIIFPLKKTFLAWEHAAKIQKEKKINLFPYLEKMHHGTLLGVYDSDGLGNCIAKSLDYDIK